MAGDEESLFGRVPELDDALDRLDEAADWIVEGRPDLAAELVQGIDTLPLRALWRRKDERNHALRRELGKRPRGGGRRGISKATEREVFERDGWHCRYCSTRVIDPEARKRFCAYLPGLGLWGRTDRARNVALLVASATADHVEPQWAGGKDDESNLVCACWVCNFGKMSWTVQELGITDPLLRRPIVDDWKGLRKLLALTGDPPSRLALVRRPRIVHSLEDFDTALAGTNAELVGVLRDVRRRWEDAGGRATATNHHGVPNLLLSFRWQHYTVPVFKVRSDTGEVVIEIAGMRRRGFFADENEERVFVENLQSATGIRALDPSAGYGARFSASLLLEPARRDAVEEALHRLLPGTEDRPPPAR